MPDRVYPPLSCTKFNCVTGDKMDQGKGQEGHTDKGRKNMKKPSKKKLNHDGTTFFLFKMAVQGITLHRLNKRRQTLVFQVYTIEHVAAKGIDFKIDNPFAHGLEHNGMGNGHPGSLFFKDHLGLLV